MQTGQLPAVLVQLPPALTGPVATAVYLAALLDGSGRAAPGRGVPQRLLGRGPGVRRAGTTPDTLVAVDEPELPGLFPPLDVVTNPDLFYVRFHGRNAQGWRSGNMQQQFDYDYSDEELDEWVEHASTKMAAQAQSGVIFFNNHVRGQAPGNADGWWNLLKRSLEPAYPVAMLNNAALHHPSERGRFCRGRGTSGWTAG